MKNSTSKETAEIAKKLRNNGIKTQSDLGFWGSLAVKTREFSRKKWVNAAAIIIFLISMVFQSSPYYQEFSNVIENSVKANSGISQNYFDALMDGIGSIADIYKSDRQNNENCEISQYLKAEIAVPIGDPPSNESGIENRIYYDESIYPDIDEK